MFVLHVPVDLCSLIKQAYAKLFLLFLSSWHLL